MWVEEQILHSAARVMHQHFLFLLISMVSYGQAKLFIYNTIYIYVQTQNRHTYTQPAQKSLIPANTRKKSQDCFRNCRW